MGAYKAIFNISFTLPSAPCYLKGNARADYIARRNFYNLTADYNYLTYTLSGKKCAKNSTAEGYFTRHGDENKASGLFGMDGVYEKEQIAELKTKLAATKSIIWHGFISFDAETSKGFTTVDAAQKFMRRTFGTFLSRAHFKRDNVTLYASLHVDKAHHHHIHFAFFENAPKKLDKNGNLGYTKRGTVSEKALEYYLESINVHLDKRFDEYYTARDAAIDSLKTARGEILSGKKKDVMLEAALRGLADKLPKTGRLQYNSENMRALRPEIDKVAKLLIVSDPTVRERNGEVYKMFAQMQTAAGSRYAYEQATVFNRAASPVDVEVCPSAYAKELSADYRGRVGNIVLGLAKQWRGKDERNRKRSTGYNDKGAKIAARRDGARRQRLLKNALIALSANAYVRADFQNSVQEIETKLQQGTAL